MKILHEKDNLEHDIFKGKIPNEVHESERNSRVGRVWLVRAIEPCPSTCDKCTSDRIQLILEDPNVGEPHGHCIYDYRGRSYWQEIPDILVDLEAAPVEGELRERTYRWANWEPAMERQPAPPTPPPLRWGEGRPTVTWQWVEDELRPAHRGTPTIDEINLDEIYVDHTRFDDELWEEEYEDEE